MPGVDVLPNFRKEALSQGRGLTLDLRAVLFADNGGATPLRDLTQRQGKSVTCSSLLAQLSNLESECLWRYEIQSTTDRRCTVMITDKTEDIAK
jgi:hypothetical protein